MGELTSASGIPIPAVAGPELLSPGWLPRVGLPGAFPFTRGIRTGMYRDRPWTIRQLAGFGAASDTNRRYRMLLERGATGVNGVAICWSMTERLFCPTTCRVPSSSAPAGAIVSRGQTRRRRGTIPPGEVPILRAKGVRAAFGSGTPLAVIVGEVARLLDGRVRVP
jgi:hypothetical protein